MSGIAGCADFAADAMDMAIPEAMLAAIAHRGPDASQAICSAKVGLGQNAFWTTPESVNERQPLQTTDGSLTLVADARIDNRHELITALLPRDRPAADITDAELILAAYRKWGQACAHSLIGDFAFAVWDAAEDLLFCARDAMGVRGLYYHYRAGRFAFASEIKALFAVPWVPRELNEIRVAEHLVSAFGDQGETFYRDIHCLPAGHYLVANASGIRLCQYWTLDDTSELQLGSDADYAEAFREQFGEAVRCRLRSRFAIGSTLSGGLDSSAVTCVAREALNKLGGPELHAFSAVFPGLPERYMRMIDERSFVAEVVDQGHLRAHQVRADLLNPIGDLETLLWHQDDPLVPFNIYLHLGMYRAARDQGIRVMLDGFDGDTTVSHGYERLPELARTFRWRTLVRETRALSARATDRRVGLAKMLWGFAVSPLLPTPGNSGWLAGRRRFRLPWSDTQLIAGSFARRMHLGAHLRQLAAREPQRFRSARRSHQQSLESPLIVYALEMADKAAAACGIEARYPFFDRRLVEFCLALPADQKFRDGWPRWILRQAMQGILPPQIQWRYSKGNLSANFFLKLHEKGNDAIQQISGDDLDAAGRYLDVDGVRRVCTRFQARQSNEDAMTVFLALAFAAWLRRSGC